MTAYIIGVGSTAFTRHPDRGFRSLTDEALDAALSDAGMPTAAPVDSVWFGNCGMHGWGQGNIRGHVCLEAAITEGLLPPHVPIVNVELETCIVDVAAVQTFVTEDPPHPPPLIAH